MADTLTPKGVLRGHTDWVTAIAASPFESDTIVSSSRDKSVLVWNPSPNDTSNVIDVAKSDYGVPRRRLTGHSHFVQDVDISNDSQFALSGSWDGELRLWDLSTGASVCRFVGHTKDVLSVAFSYDNRQIMLFCTSLTWDTNGSTLFAGYTDGVIRVWGVNSHGIM